MLVQSSELAAALPVICKACESFLVLRTRKRMHEKHTIKRQQRDTHTGAVCYALILPLKSEKKKKPLSVMPTSLRADITVETTPKVTFKL